MKPSDSTPSGGPLSRPVAQSDADLRKLAEQFAVDFGITYDKLVLKKTGSVSYKTNTGGSGGWTEGTPAVVVQNSIIIKHYSLQRQLLTELLGQHDAICGAQFLKNPRDDCTLRQQVFDRLKEMS